MTFRHIFLFLFPLAIQCQNESSWGKLRLNETVIPPYRNAVNLFNNDIVHKLITADLAGVDRSRSSLAQELYCTVQEIHFNLKQATLANDDLISQIDIHVDQLLDSISQLENETRQTETVMNESNNTIENARKQVQLAEMVVNEKQRLFSDLIGREMERSENRCKSTRRTSQWQSDIPFSNRWKRSLYEPTYLKPLSKHFCDLVMSSTYHLHAYRNSPSYHPIRTALEAARASLKKQQNQLEEETEKYRSAQSQLMTSPKQLAELNMVLQQQRTAGIVAITLNTHFKPIESRLKMVSNPSKRFFDVLKNLLDFAAIAEQLNLIYEQLLSEQMIEPIPLEISRQTIIKTNHKLALLAGKLPQLRYRQKQLHQPCAYSAPKPVTPHMDLNLNETTWTQSSNDTDSFRFRRAVSEQISKQRMDLIDDDQDDQEANGIKK